jgi:hydroxymethylpyrimidine pyrophosphatase-like HAD family hydrolase
MRFLALATDYDGTLAYNGRVAETTIAALERYRRTGRKLILVTGRRLPDLLRDLPRIDLFDSVVAEDGALLYDPATRSEKLLGEAPPPQFLAALRDREVAPLSVGRVIVATTRLHEPTMRETIADLGLELQLIFNKDWVMALPTGLNKAAGLGVALQELGIAPQSVVGVGDAENDMAFLSICGRSVAVANALPQVKERADLVTSGEHGEGVVELIDRLIASDEF